MTSRSLFFSVITLSLGLITCLPVEGGSQRGRESSRESLQYLFGLMMVGTLAKAVWDETERRRIGPAIVQLVCPRLVSPIAFSAFW